VLVTDAPADDLSSLAVTFMEVTLVDRAGRETTNLLAAPARLELLDLTGRQALLALTSLPPGTFEEVRATIEADSAEARDPAGNPVTITVNRASASTLLATPLVVSRDSSARLRLDVSAG
jgi:hypothetical protein